MQKSKWISSVQSLKNYLINSGQLSLSSKKQVAVALTVGFYLGLFPLIGTTTILCLLVSLIFRINILILQAYNILFAPVQIFAAYLFLKAGRLIFFADKEIVPQVTFYELIHAEKWESLVYLLQTAAGGILVWGLFFLLTGFVLYRLFLGLLNSENSFFRRLIKSLKVSKNNSE